MRKSLKKQIEQMIRVNHAGEFGAQMIYTGQIENLKNEKLKNQLIKIAKEEKEHFDFFNNEILEKRIRPTLMSPLWGVLGRSIGKLTSYLGETYVNACTESVEEVIVEHYKKQIDFLEKNDSKNTLKNKIKQFCDDEDTHRLNATRNLKDEGFRLNLFKAITKIGTRAAIKISKRI